MDDVILLIVFGLIILIIVSAIFGYDTFCNQVTNSTLMVDKCFIK